jgi:hypothetical protein
MDRDKEVTLQSKHEAIVVKRIHSSPQSEETSLATLVTPNLVADNSATHCDTLVLSHPAGLRRAQLISSSPQQHMTATHQLSLRSLTGREHIF